MSVVLSAPQKKNLSVQKSESESSLTITWRFLGFLSLLKSSTARLKTKALELALLADAVDIASSLVVAVLVVDFTCSDRLSTSDIFR